MKGKSNPKISLDTHNGRLLLVFHYEQKMSYIHLDLSYFWLMA